MSIKKKKKNRKQKRETLESETKNFTTHGTAHSINISIFVCILLVPKDDGGERLGPDRYLLTHWVVV